MNSTENLRLTNTDSHSGEPRIELVQHIALLCTVPTNNRALGAAVNESLYWVTIHLSVNIQHSDISKELRVVLHGCLIV